MKKMIQGAKWVLMFILAAVIILPLLPVVHLLELSMPVYLEFSLPIIELSYDLAEVPLLNHLIQNQVPQKIADYSLFSMTAIGEFLFSTTVFLAKDVIFQSLFVIAILAVLIIILFSRYLAYREKVFSITPDLNEVLNAKKRLIHQEANKIRKRGMIYLFKGIFKIEALKNGVDR